MGFGAMSVKAHWGGQRKSNGKGNHERCYADMAKSKVGLSNPEPDQTERNKQGDEHPNYSGKTKTGRDKAEVQEHHCAVGDLMDNKWPPIKTELDNERQNTESEPWLR